MVAWSDPHEGTLDLQLDGSPNVRVQTALGCVVLFFAAGWVDAQTDGIPLFERDACPFPEATIDVGCGYLLVPEDRTDPGSAIIELAVAIIPAADGTPRPDPVIYLEGGPGGSALFAAEDFQTHPIRENRDVILLDQRGTGFSFPSLNCVELEVEEPDDDALAACYERLLSEGIDLNAYNSAASAADVNDLRIALGHEEVNLWGISYGTRLALTVLRDHPESVRAVVLDSVYPPEVDSVESSAFDSLRAFAELFERCAEDLVCGSAYPTLESDFLTMVEAFGENPPLFAYEGEEIALYGDMILEAVFQTLYDSAAIPMLPYGITLLANAADDDDYHDGYDMILGYWTPATWEAGETGSMGDSIFDSDQVVAYIDAFGDVSDSEGVHSSVECAEEVVFNDRQSTLDFIDANVPPELAELRRWLYDVADIPFLDCDVWTVAPRSPIETEPVASDAPALLVSGAFDPVTPPSFAESALRTLGNGQHVVFPMGGHGESGAPGCAADLARAFFDAPYGVVDASCVPTSIDWYVE
jgi:pimeloyl-ACP methyl ester carboxylesterase